MLEVIGLSHSYGDKVLYDNASFSLFNKEHMGLVGQNGTGKSTLIKILTGEILPDKGEIIIHPKAVIGQLDQYAEIDPSLTIDVYLKQAFLELYEQEQRLNEINHTLINNPDKKLIKQASSIMERLAGNDFYSIPATIGKVCAGLGITAMGLDTPIKHLSGGQRAKVILAKLLLQKPNLLLLDEPTNFLDSNHIDWLSKYLKTYPGAFITVSHDFNFLETITNCILDIEFRSIAKYSGSYSSFSKQKEQRRLEYEKNYDSQQKLIERTEDYIARNKARASTARMAQSRQKMLNKLEKIAPPNILKEPVFSFKYTPVNAQTVLEVKNLEVGYYYPLLPKLNFSINNKQRMAITGFNGIGKSTLIKTLIGEIKALSGSFCFAQNCEKGYFAQDLIWQDEDATALSYLGSMYPKASDKEIRKILSIVAIKNEHMIQKITTLSGGEQSKVKLAQIMMHPCNILILDEPTNHLDVEAKSALIRALKKFEGTVILVSHERAFYEAWADKIINIEKLIIK